MLPEALDNEELVALRGAFDKACFELRLDDDEVGRERLGQLMVTLAKAGERDPGAPNAATRRQLILSRLRCESSRARSSTSRDRLEHAWPRCDIERQRPVHRRCCGHGEVSPAHARDAALQQSCR